MYVAIRQLELCRASRKITHLLQHVFALSLREDAHSRCRKQEKGGIWDFVEGYVFEGMAEQLVEVLRSDIVGVVAKGRDTCDMSC